MAIKKSFLIVDIISMRDEANTKLCIVEQQTRQMSEVRNGKKGGTLWDFLDFRDFLGEFSERCTGFFRVIFPSRKGSSKIYRSGSTGKIMYGWVRFSISGPRTPVTFLDKSPLGLKLVSMDNILRIYWGGYCGKYGKTWCYLQWKRFFNRKLVYIFFCYNRFFSFDPRVFF